MRAEFITVFSLRQICLQQIPVKGGSVGGFFASGSAPERRVYVIRAFCPIFGNFQHD